MSSQNPTIQCPNCGGNVDVHATKCPYCGYVNATGAQEQYIKDLETVIDKLDGIDNTEVTEFGRSMGKSLKIAIIASAVVLLIVGSFFTLNIVLERAVFSSGSVSDADEEIAKIKLQKEVYPKFDELFEAGDYAGMCDMYTEYSTKLDMWDYNNYEFINAYRSYMWIRDTYVPMLDSGRFDDGDAAYLLNHCMFFYFECYKTLIKDDAKYYKEDMEILDGIRNEYVLNLIYDRMGFSDEELSIYDQEDIRQYGYVRLDASKELAKKYYKRFK